MSSVRPDWADLRADTGHYRRRGQAVARHLFRVACGLDSAVLGDVQILDQIKEARTLASAAGTLGKCPQQTVQQAVVLGRRARAGTAISRGCASIGSALADMLAQRYRPTSSGEEACILVLGAGEAARNIAHHVRKRRLGGLCFLNRDGGTGLRAGAALGGPRFALGTPRSGAG